MCARNIISNKLYSKNRNSKCLYVPQSILLVLKDLVTFVFSCLYEQINRFSDTGHNIYVESCYNKNPITWLMNIRVHSLIRYHSFSIANSKFRQLNIFSFLRI